MRRRLAHRSRERRIGADLGIDQRLALPETAQPSADILAWPAALPDRFVAVAAVVDRAGKPIAANDVARAFKGTNAKGVGPVLDTLAGMGRLRKLEDGRYAA